MLLVSVAPKQDGSSSMLKVLYETPVDAVSLTGPLFLAAPKLLLRGNDDPSLREVPVADLTWHVLLPSGYELVHSRGTVEVARDLPEPAAIAVIKGALAAIAWRPHFRFSMGEATLAKPYYMSDDIPSFAESTAKSAAPAAAPARAPRLFEKWTWSRRRKPPRPTRSATAPCPGSRRIALALSLPTARSRPRRLRPPPSPPRPLHPRCSLRSRHGARPVWRAFAA